jgi:hypothetical protein
MTIRRGEIFGFNAVTVTLFKGFIGRKGNI